MRFLSLTDRLRQALLEDGAYNDVTTQRFPRAGRTPVRAVVIAKAPGILSGVDLISAVYRLFRPAPSVRLLKKEGARLKAGDRVAEIRGAAGPVLAGERVMLNFLCRLSGIATATRRFADAVAGTGASVYDTRKTTPLWRDLERAAVRAGGGRNHRFNLSDAILVKDNHLALVRQEGGAPHAVFSTAAMPVGLRKRLSFVCMEAASMKDVWEAVKARVDIILLDNMPPNRIKEAVLFVKAARSALRSDRPRLEVSGGVTPSRARALARLGIDRISVGALTHSAPALDLSLEVL